MEIKIKRRLSNMENHRLSDGSEFKNKKKPANWIRKYLDVSITSRTANLKLLVVTKFSHVDSAMIKSVTTQWTGSLFSIYNSDVLVCIEPLMIIALIADEIDCPRTILDMKLLMKVKNIEYTKFRCWNYNKETSILQAKWTYNIMPITIIVRLSQV